MLSDADTVAAMEGGYDTTAKDVADTPTPR